MKSTVEYVTSGHPDRLSDNIASVIIQDINHNDRCNGHAAVEVFLTHSECIISGEVTSSLNIDDEYLREAVKKAYILSGYLPEIRKYWTKEQCVLFDDVTIINKLQSQSPDIALGTTSICNDSGWNDQNISYSSSDNSCSNHIGLPMNIAMSIGEFLKSYSTDSIISDKTVKLAPDIKVLVTCETSDYGKTYDRITDITIAVPHTPDKDIYSVRAFVKAFVSNYLDIEFNEIYSNSPDINWVINGTGLFTIFGQVSDTSMTGRKLAVNHPSAGLIYMNKMIGGGSLVKPWHASDLLLAIYARYIANIVVDAGLSSYALVELSSSIGQKNIQSIFVYGTDEFNLKYSDVVIKYFINKCATPIHLAEKFDLFGDRGFDFSMAVNSNFFGNTKYHPWDDSTNKEYQDDVENLKTFLS